MYDQNIYFIGNSPLLPLTASDHPNTNNNNSGPISSSSSSSSSKVLHCWNCTNSILTAPIVQVIGDEGGVFIHTEDGNLYYIGPNSYGVSGLGHENAVKELTLCETQVESVFARYNTCFVLKKNLELYMSGSNTYGTYPLPVPSTLSDSSVLKNRLPLTASQLLAKWKVTPLIRPLSSSNSSNSSSTSGGGGGGVDDDEYFVKVSPCFSSAVLMTNKRRLYVCGQYYWYNAQSSGPNFHIIDDFLNKSEQVISFTSGNFHCSIVTNEGNCYVGGQSMQGLVKSENSAFVGFRKVDVLPGPFKASLAYKYITTFVNYANEVFLFVESNPFVISHGLFQAEIVNDNANLKKLIIDNPSWDITQAFLSYNHFVVVTKSGTLVCQQQQSQQYHQYGVTSGDDSADTLKEFKTWYPQLHSSDTHSRFQFSGSITDAYFYMAQLVNPLFHKRLMTCCETNKLSDISISCFVTNDY